jgi:mxaA protein
MRCAIVAVIMIIGLAAANAQVRSVELVTPRLFGYFVGDVIHSDVDVVVDKTAGLVSASVPRPGPLNAWLELIDSRVEESSAGNAKRYYLHFAYQNFYPALDSRALEVPGFALSFTSGDKTISVQVPAWSFLISSLREVQPAPKASGADYMQPDAKPRGIDLRGDEAAAVALTVAFFAAIGLLAYHLAWWPFRARTNRPFTDAARQIRKLFSTTPNETHYPAALLVLHRAVDATAGHAVFAEDLPDFLEHAPAFSSLSEDFGRFFRSSRQVFFGNNVPGAVTDFGMDELSRFSRKLAAVEKRVV